MELGKAIKLARTQKGLTQTDLATLAGISVSYLSVLEVGKRDPAFSTVEKIAKALKLPVPLLIFLAEDKEKIAGISADLAEKLSITVLNLIRAASQKRATDAQ